MSTLDPILADLIPKLVPGLCRKFRTLEREDIEQECWAGILANRAQLETLAVAGQLDKIANDAKDYATKAVLAARREQDRYDRVLKASKAGYDPADEMFYSIPLLRVLIPAYLDCGVSPHAPKSYKESAQSTAGITGGQGDPAEAGNWLAFMIDVDQAFWKVSRHHRNLLARYFSYPTTGTGHFTHEQIAGRLGIEPGALRGRIDRALRAMQRELGGPK